MSSNHYRYHLTRYRFPGHLQLSCRFYDFPALTHSDNILHVVNKYSMGKIALGRKVSTVGPATSPPND